MPPKYSSFQERVLDLDIGKRLLMVIFAGMALLLTACGLYPAMSFYHYFRPSVDSLGMWILLVFAASFFFNLGYILGLLALRLVIPKPKFGFYETQPDGRPHPATMLYMFNVILTKLRFNVPWAFLLPSVIAFPGINGAYRKIFGPDSSSATMGDTVKMIDPWALMVGKRVQLGFGATLTSHFYDQRGLRLDPIILEDDVTIGGESCLMSGVTVGHHSIVGAGSLVLPNTKIPPYELWGGVPAKKLKDLKIGDRTEEKVG